MSNSKSDVVTIDRETLAKCFSLMGQSFVAMLSNNPLLRGSLDNSFKTHMEPGYLEKIITGMANDFENFDKP